jgi:PKD repeat protein
MAENTPYIIIGVATAAVAGLVIYSLVSKGTGGGPPPPPPPPTCDGTLALQVNNPGAFGIVTFTAVPTNIKPIMYDWNFGDGISYQQDNPQAQNIYSKSGTYTVTVTATDVNGCQAVATKSIYVNAGF